MSLLHQLSDIFVQAFIAQSLPPDLGIVRRADRPDLAQFQCNGALAGAKQLGKNPREVAEAVVKHLEGHPEFSKLEIAGPGFINITVNDDVLAAAVQNAAATDILKMPGASAQTVVLDYGGPNIAKSMHVGHLRSAIIGDCLRRIMLAAGFNVVADVHMGDWGTHMGMLIGDYIAKGETDVVLKNSNAANPDHVETLMFDMATRYPRAAGEAKENPEIMARAHAATLALQEGQKPHRALWHIIRDISVTGMKANFDALGVEFTEWKGESNAHPFIAAMVEDLKARALAEQSDGAWIVKIAEESDKKEMPPLILYKRDGAVMYGTTDLATIVQRMQYYHPARIIYVVDQRQSLHFEQVFRAARRSDIAGETVELIHAGFGTMNGPDGKPFKTRAGGVMRLEDLIELAREKAVQRLREANLATGTNEAEQADISNKVALAAIKFADLQNNRIADYQFDIDRMTVFEGKTGPYLLYQVVRIKSLLAKAGAYDAAAPIILSPLERELALALISLPDEFAAALKHYSPHILCDYAYRLAQSFSTFYAACHILSEENAALRASRLALCALTARTLTLVLELLGIQVPERM